MYNVLLYLYQLGVAVASLFSKKVRTMWRGERAAFGELRRRVEPGARYVWFHAASLGEFEQGRPLMEELRRQRPELKILLTFFSPSGYEVRKNYAGADIVCYLPIDTAANARRFLSLVRPEMAFFIKYEFWYNYLHILRHRGVPVYSVSSIFRPGQVFFRWYGRQYGRVLHCFTHFFVQNEQSRVLLARLGLLNASVTGDTRFDRVLQVKRESKVLPLCEAFAADATRRGQRTMVVGSSWEADEQVYLPYFARHKEWRLIIATHVVSDERVQRLRQQLTGLGLSSATYQVSSERGAALCDSAQVSCADVLIINCYGLLSSIYRYGSVALVGGGFGVGIHNLPEAAVWSIPVLFGPNNQRFQEAQDLKRLGGGFELTTTADLERTMDRLARDKQAYADAAAAAGRYVAGRSGATQKILELAL